MIPRPSQTALALILSVLMTGCASTSATGPKVSEATKAQAKVVAEQAKKTDADAQNLIRDDPIAAAAYWGALYDSNPKDANAAANYGEALRQIGSNEKAVGVMRDAANLFPDDSRVLAAYGKALAASNQPQDALPYLEKAATLDAKNVQTLSAAGVVQDQLGHPEQAKLRYEQALKLKPENPVLLNNYGLSRAFAGDLPKAEELLRRAVTLPGVTAQMRQNLALVLGLAGKFAEAGSLSRSDLPAADTETNMAYIRALKGEPTAATR
jgi:Flp pilus assembly protein TadD